MKSLISSRSYQICAAAIVAGLLSACGQTGPLYMPKVPAAPAAAQTTPAPAAQPSAQPVTK